MQESFLHFLWRFQYFDKQCLQTVQGEPIRVLRPGLPHQDAGPDFSQARALINGIEWAGHVEIHLRASDWNAHAHQHDAAYDNVILHVVWQDDVPIRRRDGSAIPTLELQSRTDKRLLSRYQAILRNQEGIPCAQQFGRVSELEKIAMLDRVLMQRLQQKAAFVTGLWEANRRDWEETAYQLLAKNFGFHLNSEAFLKLSQGLPLKILRKHRDNLTQVEALLFGQAGLLDAPPTDAYSRSLRREYDFLSHKYGLPDRKLAAHAWKFMRLRPANFPTVRLAQFARLVSQEPGLFDLLTQSDSLKALRKQLLVQQSAYWQAHYTPGKPATGQVPVLGKSAAENLIVNVAVPLLVSYAGQQGNRAHLERAVDWLEQLPAEHNHLTRMWQALGLKVKTSFDSQASIEWHNHFCATKQCLQCHVGVSLLKSETG